MNGKSSKKARLQAKVESTIIVRVDKGLKDSLENEYKAIKECPSLSSYIRYILIHRKRKIHLQAIDERKHEQLIEEIIHIKNMLLAEKILRQKRGEDLSNLEIGLRHCQKVIEMI